MRIVCISDTHDQHEKVVVPDGDVLIHAGDHACHRTAIPESTIRFNDWLGKLPHRYKVVIAGNHDTLFEQQPYLARSLITNAVYLEDSGIDFGGLVFWGSPYTPFWDHWAFGVRIEDNIKWHWDRIPYNTNVLITHGPPFRILDKNILGTHNVEGGHAGCMQLRSRVSVLRDNNLLVLHVFGHIHEGYGRDGIFVNASQVDERNNMKNKPIVVDI